MKRQQQGELFPIVYLRKKNGQFCTKEQFLTDRTNKENEILKRKVEKYYRAWLAACKEVARLQRELNKR